MGCFAMQIFPEFIGSPIYLSIGEGISVGCTTPIPGGLAQSNSLIRFGDGEY